MTTGLQAKTALIRSESLIRRIHEITKQSLHDELDRLRIRHGIHPPIGEQSPELHIWGYLKKKKQDVVVFIGDAQRRRERIEEGPLKGQTDEVGGIAAKNAMVIGVRSQLSSVNKNFDTLMERTFAESFNLRLRHPQLVMGEVYLLAVKDYDEQLMKSNRVGWKTTFTKIERFISIFNGFSQRNEYVNVRNFYKYERCLLLLVDFSSSPPKIFETIDELRQSGIVSPTFQEDFSKLSPVNFSSDLVSSYLSLHQEEQPQKYR